MGRRLAFHFRKVDRGREEEVLQMGHWRRAQWLAFLAARMPVIAWLPSYEWRAWLLDDLLGGLMVSVMCIPQGPCPLPPL